MNRTQLFYLIPSVLIMALSVSMAIIPLVIRAVNKFGLLDTPNERSSHLSPTPTMGGIAVFAGFLSVAIVFGYYIPHSLLLLIAVSIIFLCGLLDDLFDISPFLRLFGEFLAAFLICFADVRLKGFYGFLGIDTIHIVLQYTITMFIIVGVTNAFNLIDGIDGLAGGIGAINAAIIGILFLYSDRLELSLLAFALTGALLGFLYFNFNPASIFMGDAGSLPVGFILACLGIQLMETNIIVNDVIVSSHSTLLLVMGVLFLPVFDFIRVVIYRLSNNKSPFQADKMHIHHLLVGLGFSHRTSTVILYCTNLIIVSFSFLMKDFWIEISMVALFLFCYSSLEFLSFRKIKNIDKELNHLDTNKQSLLDKNRLLNN